MASAHKAAQRASIIQARLRVATRSLPSAPESIAESPAITVSASKADEEEHEDAGPGTTSGRSNAGDRASSPESEDQLPTTSAKQPASRAAKRNTRSSDPPPNDEPGAAEVPPAGAGVKGKGKPAPNAPPTKKRARKGSTASSAIQLDSDGDNVENVGPHGQAAFNSSCILPPNVDEFWDQIRRITGTGNGPPASSTPNPAGPRQLAADNDPLLEQSRPAPMAVRGCGCGKSVGTENPATRGGKRGILCVKATCEMILTATLHYRRWSSRWRKVEIDRLQEVWHGFKEVGGAIMSVSVFIAPTTASAIAPHP